MEQPLPTELVRHVATSTGLPHGTAARVIADVIAFFGETTEEFVRRRHRELKVPANRALLALLAAISA